MNKTPRCFIAATCTLSLILVTQLACEPPAPGGDGDPDGDGSQDTGACCLGVDDCQIVAMADCPDAGINFAGADTTCDEIDCSEEGSCCLTDGETCEPLSRVECEAMDGYFDAGLDCVAASCGDIVTASCCVAANSDCAIRSKNECDALGGEFRPDADCADLNCAP
ncbi:MAG TPA: hypothetical protein PKN33_15510 [Phycisphaerae bacterium]|nr:hypothetical protein [Phycisphaerae bacterium]